MVYPPQPAVALERCTTRWNRLVTRTSRQRKKVRRFSDPTGSENAVGANEAPATTSDRGVVLVAVLWICLFLAITVGSMAALAQKSRLQAEKVERRAQIDAVVDGALTLVATRIAQGDRWATDATLSGAPLSFRLFDAAVVVQTTPEHAKIDLNRADLGALTELFSHAGADPRTAIANAAATLDFRDANDLTRANGAEADAYLRAGLDFGPRNGPFADVVELSLVFGVAPEIAAAAAARATVFGGRETLRRANAAGRLSRSAAPRSALRPTAAIGGASHAAPAGGFCLHQRRRHRRRWRAQLRLGGHPDQTRRDPAVLDPGDGVARLTDRMPQASPPKPWDSSLDHSRYRGNYGFAENRALRTDLRRNHASHASRRRSRRNAGRSRRRLRHPQRRPSSPSSKDFRRRIRSTTEPDASRPRRSPRNRLSNASAPTRPPPPARSNSKTAMSSFD